MDNRTLDEARARAIARIFGGEARRNRVGEWIVRLKRGDGCYVQISADAIEEFSSDLDLHDLCPCKHIWLR